MLTRQKVVDALERLHRDEQGDEGVNKILIIAMIVIPLVIVLIAFGGTIKEFFVKAWEDLTGHSVGEATFGSGGGTGP